MNIVVCEYKGRVISIDERGQFCATPGGSYNPGTSLDNIKEDIDFIEDYKAAAPVKFIRVEYPYLQIWNLRSVTRRKDRYARAGWYTKDDVYGGPDGDLYPRHFDVSRGMIPYNEATYSECEQIFKQLKSLYDRLDVIVNSASVVT
jgi:hypothetical protein